MRTRLGRPTHRRTPELASAPGQVVLLSLYSTATNSAPPHSRNRGAAVGSHRPCCNLCGIYRDPRYPPPPSAAAARNHQFWALCAACVLLPCGAVRRASCLQDTEKQPWLSALLRLLLCPFRLAFRAVADMPVERSPPRSPPSCACLRIAFRLSLWARQRALGGAAGHCQHGQGCDGCPKGCGQRIAVCTWPAGGALLLSDALAASFS